MSVLISCCSEESLWCFNHLDFSALLYFPLCPDKQTIPAQTGETVTLPCQAPRNNISTVKWTTTKLEKSDKEEFVWLSRDGHVVQRNQHPDFVGRVEPEDSQLKDGNLSIVLKNVTTNDTGKYICQFIDSVGGRGNCTVILNVKDSGEICSFSI